jgi:6,7-dimethyl-8-ribityllumazine synthase
MKIVKANLDAGDKSFAIVISRFNEFISSKLLEGALDCLQRHNADDKKITVVWVPGSFEIPMAAQKLAAGKTSHNEYIANEVTKGIAQIGLQTGIPVVLGVITPDNLEQAIERAGTKLGNKGFEAAMTAIELANLARMI